MSSGMTLSGATSTGTASIVQTPTQIQNNDYIVSMQLSYFLLFVFIYGVIVYAF